MGGWSINKGDDGMSEAVKCLDCPVCGHQPMWHGSMIRDAESICCNWEDHCPEDSFDFDTGYLPVTEAVESWNRAVTEWRLNRRDGSE